MFDRFREGIVVETFQIAILLKPLSPSWDTLSPKMECNLTPPTQSNYIHGQPQHHPRRSECSCASVHNTDSLLKGFLNTLKSFMLGHTRILFSTGLPGSFWNSVTPCQGLSQPGRYIFVTHSMQSVQCWYRKSTQRNMWYCMPVTRSMQQSANCLCLTGTFMQLFSQWDTFDITWLFIPSW
jgi:hypothetical protein